MARPEKAAAVQEIAERFEGSEATLLTEYRGLRVAEIAEVRGALREADAEYKVLKNTLARIAVRDVGLEELVEMLEGPTAIVFVKGDVAAAAKALDDAAKKYPVIVVKGGALKGRVFDADQAKALAKLEPREVLLTKIAMMMNSPAQQTANVLSALLRNLGSMLAQVVTKKESGELPGGTSADAEPESETPAPTTDPAEGSEGESPEEDAPQPSTEPAEGADDPAASGEAPGPAEDAAAEAAAEADAGETTADEPEATDDPAAEAAEEASAGEAAAPISSSDDASDKEEEE